MGKIISVFGLIACLSLTAACSRRAGASSFDGVFEKLSTAKGFGNVKQYYTDNTVAAIEDAADEGVISDKEKLSILPLFNDKTKWEEISKKSDGSHGVIRIQYTKHPVENMIGFEMEFRVVKERGSWKLDLEDEIRKALRGRKRGGAAEYIQRIKKGY